MFKPVDSKQLPDAERKNKQKNEGVKTKHITYK